MRVHTLSARLINRAAGYATGQRSRIRAEHIYSYLGSYSCGVYYIARYLNDWHTS